MANFVYSFKFTEKCWI